MRIGELIALTWDDVSFSDNTINVTKTLSLDPNGNAIIQPPKTASSKRLLDMDSETMQILKRWQIMQASYLLKRGINAMDKGQAVFINPQNKHLTSAGVRGGAMRSSKQAIIYLMSLSTALDTHTPRCCFQLVLVQKKYRSV